MDDFNRVLLRDFYKHDLNLAELPEHSEEFKHRLALERPRYLVKKRNFKTTALMVMVCLGSTSALVFATAWNQLHIVQDTFSKLVNEGSERLVQLADLEAVTNHLFLLERDFLAEDLTKEMELKKNQLFLARGRMDRLLSQVAAESRSDVQKQAAELQVALTAWKTFDDQIQKLALGGDPDAANAQYRAKGATLRAAVDTSLKTLALNVREHQEHGLANLPPVHEKFKLQLIFSGGLLLLSFIVSLFSFRDLNHLLQQIVSRLRRHAFDVRRTSQAILDSRQPDHATDRWNEIRDALRSARASLAEIESPSLATLDSAKVSERVEALSNVAGPVSGLLTRIKTHAFNASVEAQRSSGQHSGFAALADEAELLVKEAETAHANLRATGDQESDKIREMFAEIELQITEAFHGKSGAISGLESFESSLKDLKESTNFGPEPDAEGDKADRVEKHNEDLRTSVTELIEIFHGTVRGERSPRQRDPARVIAFSKRESDKKPPSPEPSESVAENEKQSVS